MSTPAFQFYPADFLHGTTLMSSAAVGAYIRMLCCSWELGAIPDRERALYKALGLGIGDPGLADIWNEVRPHWSLTKEGWVNPRLEGTRKKLDAYLTGQAEKGKLSAKVMQQRRAATKPVQSSPAGHSSTKSTIPESNREGTEPATAREPNHQPEPQPSHQPETSSPISDLRSSISDLRSSDSNLRSPNQQVPRASRSARRSVPDPRFESFWNAYPRKVNKVEARKIWDSLDADDAMLAGMLTALQWQREQVEWQTNGGRYIPHPGLWLRNRRWEDEPVVSTGDATDAAWDRVTAKVGRA